MKQSAIALSIMFTVAADKNRHKLAAHSGSAHRSSIRQARNNSASS
ncbi:MAG: hypothetical protein ACYCY8_10560 [Burkholderiales bacterium]